MKNVRFLIVTSAILFSSATFAAEIIPTPADTSASTAFHANTMQPKIKEEPKKKIPQKAQAAKQQEKKIQPAEETPKKTTRNTMTAIKKKH